MKIIKLSIVAAILCIAFNLNAQTNSDLQKVLNNYIGVKDALVKTDGAAAASSATDLYTAIEGLSMNELPAGSRTIWMKIVQNLKEDATHIRETKEIAHQRDHFMSLSKNLYAVFKVSNIDTPIYYQFCPMANKGKGANWLSLENKIKNPYYGNQMLSCGKVLDAIQ